MSQHLGTHSRVVWSIIFPPMRAILHHQLVTHCRLACMWLVQCEDTSHDVTAVSSEIECPLGPNIAHSIVSLLSPTREVALLLAKVCDCMFHCVTSVSAELECPLRQCVHKQSQPECQLATEVAAMLLTCIPLCHCCLLRDRVSTRSVVPPTVMITWVCTVEASSQEQRA